jgi:DNA-binding MurR/RpiR family transcriptional regulator
MEEARINLMRKPRRPIVGSPAQITGQHFRPCLATIRNMSSSLPRIQKEIANYILANPEHTVYSSIVKVAAACNASVAAVAKFSKGVGYKGFSELKINLARELVLPDSTEDEHISAGDDAGVVIRKVFATDVKALEDTLALQHPDQLQQAATMIAKARMVRFFAIGGSYPIASLAYVMLSRMGINCFADSDYHCQMISASLMGKQDVAFGISYTGLSKETTTCLRVAKSRGAKVISLTNSFKCPVTELADVTLFAASNHITYSQESATSRIAQLALLDALAVVIALGDLRRSMMHLELARDAVEQIKEPRRTNS